MYFLVIIKSFKYDNNKKTKEHKNALLRIVLN